MALAALDRRRPAALRPLGRRHPPRIMPFQNARRYLEDRVSETLGLLYAMHWPYRQFETRAGHAPHAAPRPPEGAWRLLRRGRRLGAANWFAPKGSRAGIPIQLRTPELVRRTRATSMRPCASGSASSTCRPSASSGCEGRDAERVLQRICANDVDVASRARRLHPVAQRTRRHRGRPDGHAPRRGRASWS